jgi:hypothetical protein
LEAAMSRSLFGQPRHFEVWEYSASHRQLLLRSTKSAVCPTRITVQFLFVSEIHLPTSFEALEIADVSTPLFSENPEGLLEAKGLGRLRFEIRSRELVGHVYASCFVVLEDTLDYAAPTHLDLPRRSQSGPAT